MTMFNAALAYLRAGITTIPVKLDGTKAPAVKTWKQYIDRAPTEKELAKLFAEPSGIAILAGFTSAGLEVIDFDSGDLFEPWCELIDKLAPGLLPRLPVVKTPNGYHVYLRCSIAGADGKLIFPGNQKLAMAAEQVAGKKSNCLIETRGHGGYVIAPPSPEAVHESGIPYIFLRKIPDSFNVTPEERDVLLSAARSFGHVPDEQRPTTERGQAPSGKGRPGDDFNQRATWPEILQPHGWRIVGHHGKVTYWQRPGKDGRGVSATTGHTGDKLYVFSSNAHPLDSMRAYGKFSVFAHLAHGGDFSAASRELRDRGFGEVRAPQQPRKPSPEKWAELTAGLDRIAGGAALALVPPMPNDDDAPPDIEPVRKPQREPLTAARLEVLLDDNPLAHMEPETFERILEQRSNLAEWVAINDLLRRRKKKADFTMAVKAHDVKAKQHARHDGWKANLKYRTNKDGDEILERCVYNFVQILTHDDSWRGVLRLNLLNNQITVGNPLPFRKSPGKRWSDADTYGVKIWIEEHYPLRPTTNDVHEAIVTVATSNPFNPLTDYLMALPAHEGESVIDSWLTDVFGVEDTPYTRAVGARWLIQAVARALDPGCQADSVLILEGSQGLKKSTTLKKLCPDESWFNDSLTDFGTKDQKEQIEGRWIVELGELQGFGTKELNTIKAFVSRTKEDYRPAYGRNTIESPRTCVFAGTYNPDGIGYFRDTTGNRRFLPVLCTKLAPTMTPEIRDRLWAEARDRYINRDQTGEKYWIDPEETSLMRDANEQQAARIEQDAWHEPIVEALQGKQEVSWSDLYDAVKVPVHQREQKHQNRISRVLKLLGWEKHRASYGARPYVYRPGPNATHRKQEQLPL